MVTVALIHEGFNDDPGSREISVNLCSKVLQSFLWKSPLSLGSREPGSTHPAGHDQGFLDHDDGVRSEGDRVDDKDDGCVEHADL